MKIEPKEKTKDFEHASLAENKKYPLQTYRIPESILTKMEMIRLAIGQKTGKIPSRTKVLIQSVEEMHDKLYIK